MGTVHTKIDIYVKGKLKHSTFFNWLWFVLACGAPTTDKNNQVDVTITSVASAKILSELLSHFLLCEARSEITENGL